MKRLLLIEAHLLFRESLSLEELDGVPVLALIGSRNLERQAEAMRLGADEVLSTTGPVEKIAAAVERLVGR